MHTRVHTRLMQTRQYLQRYVFKITPTQLVEHVELFSIYDPNHEKWIPTSLLGNLLRRSNMVFSDAEIARIITGLSHPFYLHLAEYLRKWTNIIHNKNRFFRHGDKYYLYLLIFFIFRNRQCLPSQVTVGRDNDLFYCARYI